MKRCHENYFNIIPFDAFNFLHSYLDPIAKKSLTSVDKSCYKACSDRVASLRLSPPKNTDAPLDILPRLINRFPNIRKLEFGPHEYRCNEDKAGSESKEKYLRALISFLEANPSKHPLSHVRSLKVHEIDSGNLPFCIKSNKQMEELNHSFLKSLVHSQLESLVITTLTNDSVLKGKEIKPLLEPLLLLKKFEFNGELGECSFKNQENLVSLRIEQLTGQTGTVESLKTCKKLHSLSVKCLFESSEIIRVLSWHSWPLRRLEISKINDHDDLNALTKQLPELEHFSIMGNFTPKQSDLIALSINCPKLRMLKIGYSLLNNNDLVLLTKGLSQLETISFEAPRITGEGVAFIAENCPNLRILILSHIGNLNRTGIEALINYCPKITKLKIDETGPIAYEDLLYLIQKMPRLRQFEIMDIQGLTNEQLNNLNTEFLLLRKNGELK